MIIDKIKIGPLQLTSNVDILYKDDNKHTI